MIEDPRQPDVILCECLARDGLQHEPDFVPTATKIGLVDRFAALGFRRVEATSFTHPGNVPQFADSDEVLAGIARRPGTAFKATCVNLRSIERANDAARRGIGPEEISVIAIASEAMLQKVLKRSWADQLSVAGTMLETVDSSFTVIGTVSSALGCPIEGAVSLKQVVDLATWFHARGVRHIAIGDTTGLGTPFSVRELFRVLKAELPDAVLIAHFHDTRGLGIANCLAAYEVGVTHFDCAFGGTGGSPARLHYADGFSGNVCSEDLVNMFECLGVRTGLDLDGVVETALLCEATLGRELYGRVARSGFGLHTS